jgi:predicted RNA methylase
MSSSEGVSRGLNVESLEPGASLLRIQTLQEGERLTPHLRTMRALLDAGLRTGYETQEYTTITHEQLKRSLEATISQMPYRLTRWPGDAHQQEVEQVTEYERVIGRELLRILCTNTDFVQLHTVLNDKKDYKDNGSMDMQDYLRHVINDLPRTKLYAEAVANAVHMKAKSLEGKRRIRVCDAGCGAFPILAIIAALENSNVDVMCYEINPYAAQLAREIVRSLGLQDRIHIEHADATKVQMNNRQDIIISETLWRGATDEQLFQIMEQLSKQLEPHGFLIPKYVRLQASLLTNKLMGGSGSPRELYIYDLHENFLPVRQISADGKVALEGKNVQVPTTTVRYETSDSPDTIRLAIPLSRDEYIAYMANWRNYVVLLNTEVGLGRGNRTMGKYDSHATGPQIVTIDPPLRETHDFGVEPRNASFCIAIEYKPGENSTRVKGRLEVVKDY